MGEAIGNLKVPMNVKLRVIIFIALDVPIFLFPNKKTFWGGEEKVREAYLFFSEQNVLGWAGYPMG